jgi:CheY-like chemotaxis protein
MKKILLVSSSDPFLERNRAFFKRTDIRIHTATSGVDALMMHHEMAFDLILSEMKLDDMGGDQLCARVKAEELFGPLAFVLVCRDNDEELARANECGASAVLPKPLKPLQLIKTVSRFLTVQVPRSKRVALRVRVLSKLGESLFTCLSHNVSTSGILLETEHLLQIGDELVCIFEIPGSGEINAEGEVVRKARSLDGTHQYGIQFIRMDKNSRLEIDRYIIRENRGQMAPAR